MHSCIILIAIREMGWALADRSPGVGVGGAGREI